MAIKKRFPYKAAFVACNGGCRATADCQYGCVGCELCVNVCKFEAIALNEYGVAEVNEDKCIACGKCVRTCFYDAITKNSKQMEIDKSKCDGCGLCTQLCALQAVHLEPK